MAVAAENDATVFSFLSPGQMAIPAVDENILETGRRWAIVDPYVTCSGSMHSYCISGKGIYCTLFCYLYYSFSPSLMNPQMF